MTGDQAASLLLLVLVVMGLPIVVTLQIMGWGCAVGLLLLFRELYRIVLCRRACEGLQLGRERLVGQPQANKGARVEKRCAHSFSCISSATVEPRRVMDLKTGSGPFGLMRPTVDPSGSVTTWRSRPDQGSCGWSLRGERYCSSRSSVRRVSIGGSWVVSPAPTYTHYLSPFGQKCDISGRRVGMWAEVKP